MDEIGCVIGICSTQIQDGNGWLSRILTALLLLRCGYAYTPTSRWKAFEQNKESYYLALHQTQGTLRAESPNWQPWLLFFLRTLHQQVQRLKKKVERERLLLAALPELAIQIVEHVRQHGRVMLKEMHLLTGASRNTLKEHFRHLTAAGQLEMQGKGRGVWYRLK